MSPTLVIAVIVGYFAVLLVVSHLTARKGDNSEFFIGNKRSPWYLVAFGMVGTTLSGVTFISVPGWVGDSSFSYLQMVLGNIVGYIIIATVLLPLYYRNKLTSIYTYLGERFGFYSYKTGAFFFILSRTIGAAFRLFLVASVMHLAIFEHWDVPFRATVLITIILIWIYTFRGGIKTIVWTDALQTFFMLLTVVLSIRYIAGDMDLNISGMIRAVQQSSYSQIFFLDWQGEQFFVKQFFAGMFIAIVMTGLDQDMMQKSLSIRTLKDAKKNLFWFAGMFAFVNFFFLSLGALLYIFANQNGIPIPEQTDELFPTLAIDHFSPLAGIVFVLGLVAAAYSSADSALTALTTSFCVDFLGFEQEHLHYKKGTKPIRYAVHFSFSAIVFGVIVVFNAINNEAVISSVFTAAGYTYGPLLGLYSFGMFTKYEVRDNWIPMVCILSPVLSYIINIYSKPLTVYEFGFEILILNGLLTFAGLMIARK
ncbi:MAG: sodium:solute symporter [Bacteroidetes bacterium SW_11_45_7]|nr:MAG: sodium:solute symporter [Bacteroidetes bacterium SW_11_45_7]